LEECNQEGPAAGKIGLKLGIMTRQSFCQISFQYLSTYLIRNRGAANKYQCVHEIHETMMSAAGSVSSSGADNFLPMVSLP
jgi:hypothetical protein